MQGLAVKDFTVRSRSSQGPATVPVITATLILWLQNRVLNTGREGCGGRVASRDLLLAPTAVGNLPARNGIRLIDLLLNASIGATAQHEDTPKTQLPAAEWLCRPPAGRMLLAADVVTVGLAT